jgi:hypothetical protein
MTQKDTFLYFAQFTNGQRQRLGQRAEGKGPEGKGPEEEEARA